MKRNIIAAFVLLSATLALADFTFDLNRRIDGSGGEVTPVEAGRNLQVTAVATSPVTLKLMTIAFMQSPHNRGIDVPLVAGTNTFTLDATNFTGCNRICITEMGRAENAKLVTVTGAWK